MGTRVFKSVEQQLHCHIELFLHGDIFSQALFCHSWMVWWDVLQLLRHQFNWLSENVFPWDHSLSCSVIFSIQSCIEKGCLCMKFGASNFRPIDHGPSDRPGVLAQNKLLWRRHKVHTSSQAFSSTWLTYYPIHLVKGHFLVEWTWAIIWAILVELIMTA